LFATEVLSRKITKASMFAQAICVSSAFVFNLLFHEHSMFAISELHWKFYSIPYFFLLGIFAGLNSVYLTKSVILIKRYSSKLNNEKLRIIVGAGILGFLLFLFPSLYGEGYHSLNEFVLRSLSEVPESTVLIGLLCVLLLKPIATSITLSIGGDGGIFAPSLFMGAVLGLVIATVLNSFGLNVNPLNFILIGMAAVLSSSIHAPFTAVFLVCGLTGNYSLIVPLFISCLVSMFIAKKILPYTVYSYSGK
jgi:chloride channel protein, CIC family